LLLGKYPRRASASRRDTGVLVEVPAGVREGDRLRPGKDAITSFTFDEHPFGGSCRRRGGCRISHCRCASPPVLPRFGEAARFAWRGTEGRLPTRQKARLRRFEPRARVGSNSQREALLRLPLSEHASATGRSGSVPAPTCFKSAKATMARAGAFSESNRRRARLSSVDHKGRRHSRQSLGPDGIGAPVEDIEEARALFGERSRPRRRQPHQALDLRDRTGTTCRGSVSVPAMISVVCCADLLHKRVVDDPSLENTRRNCLCTVREKVGVGER